MTERTLWPISERRDIEKKQSTPRSFPVHSRGGTASFGLCRWYRGFRLEFAPAVLRHPGRLCLETWGPQVDFADRAGRIMTLGPTYEVVRRAEEHASSGHASGGGTCFDQAPVPEASLVNGRIPDEQNAEVADPSISAYLPGPSCKDSRAVDAPEPRLPAKPDGPLRAVSMALHDDCSETLAWACTRPVRCPHTQKHES